MSNTNLFKDLKKLKKKLFSPQLNRHCSQWSRKNEGCMQEERKREMSTNPEVFFKWFSPNLAKIIFRSL